MYPLVGFFCLNFGLESLGKKIFPLSKMENSCRLKEMKSY